jgi:hypothetical protein
MGILHHVDFFPWIVTFCVYTSEVFNGHSCRPLLLWPWKKNQLWILHPDVCESIQQTEAVLHVPFQGKLHYVVKRYSE